MGALRGQNLIIIQCVLAATCQGILEIQRATVYWDATQKTVYLRKGIMDSMGDAYGYFNDSLSITGWNVLEIKAGYGKIRQPDEVTFFIAGYLEGHLTAEQMFSHYINMYPQLIKDKRVLAPLRNFLREQDAWTREQVKQNKNDPLWQHAGLVIAQLDGLQAGAADWAKKQQRQSLSMFAIQFLNAVGDLLDLVPVLRSRRFSLSDLFSKPTMGHCSVLIKMLPGYENLLFAHSSWYTYAASMRIYKHWDLRLSSADVATGKMSFSSYPGLLTSLDDFYLLGSGLLMTQTTNSVYNNSLFSSVTPQSLLAWQRVRLANAMARTGEHWASIFSKYNSGTYNNQYMVVDLNRVTLGRKIDDGALTVVEQIPGLVVSSDQTQALRQGYWASYNVPFHRDIYNLSGYELMWSQLGEDYSYDLCPRAKIFRRDQGRVLSWASMKHIMRYNNYKKDPYAKGHPCKTICCRNDLRIRRPHPTGCYDTKVTDYLHAQKFVAEAVSGPPTQGGLPPFSWERFNRTSHMGLPQMYNFSFVTMQPLLFTP
ncbi:phospholipase B-like 1 [Alosa sapidissima]|uniref:phospholipase B-like 1 n=1 Tax=Alosa sapidissima TaxID=34773 RepID=UPI001C08A3BD|nr:phospholipase B-like 1 [Alosa sapidissima]